MSRLTYAALALILSISSTASPTEPQNPLAEFQSLADSVKQFSRQYGYKKTKNFSQASPTGENNLYFHEKNRIPFSYLDMREIFVSATTVLEAAQKLKLDPEKYDFYLYTNIVYAGNTKITPALLQETKREQVEDILHEDWHVTADLPLHLEEASANILDTAGAALFLGEEVQIDQRLKEALRWWESINQIHGELSNLAQLLAEKQIAQDDYLQKRGQALAVWEQKQKIAADICQICHWHSYSYYFPLMHRLFYATGKDLQKFSRILLNLPPGIRGKEPRGSLTNEQYFQATRAAEIRVEAYLETIIEGLECK